MAFNMQDYMKGKKVSQTKARQEVADEIGRGAGYWLEDILKDIQKKATTKSEKKGFLGDWGKVDFLRQGLISLVPGGNILNLIDSIVEKNRKQKDYKKMINNLKKLGLKIPSKFEDTFAESQLVGSVDQATQMGVSNIQSMKEAEKLAGNIDIFLSALPAIKDIPGSGKVTQGIKDVAQGAAEVGVGKIAGAPAGTLASEAVSKTLGAGGNLLDKFISPLVKTPFTTPGPFIPGAGEEAFKRVVSPLHIARTFKPSLTDMLIGEPEDITMRGINVPQVNAPRRRGY